MTTVLAADPLTVLYDGRTDAPVTSPYSNAAFGHAAAVLLPDGHTASTSRPLGPTAPTTW